MNNLPSTAPRRYRLPSEDDDAFAPACHFNHHGNRGIKRSLDSDEDVFFRPRARLASDSSPFFPRARLPSDSDSSSVFYPRHHHRFRSRENRCYLLPPPESSSIQLSSSHYTADDTSESVFKTPCFRPMAKRRKSSEASSLQPNSSREYSAPLLKDPPKVTRTPFFWTSPNLSNVTSADDNMADVRNILFNLNPSLSSPSDISFLDIPTSTPLPPITSSPVQQHQRQVKTHNLAESLLSEELKSDSGISSLPSFDGQGPFNQYQKNIEEKLVGVMVNILNKVDPPVHHPHLQTSITAQACHLPVFPSGLSIESTSSTGSTSYSSSSDVFNQPTPATSSVDIFYQSPSTDVFTVSTPLLSPSDFLPPPTPAPSPSDIFSHTPRLSTSSSDNIFTFPPSVPPTPAPSPTEVSIYGSSVPPTPVPSPELILLTSSTTPEVFVQGSSVLPPPVAADTVEFQKPIKKKKIQPKVQCPVCYKILANKHNLKSHMRIHTGERPFACTFCPKTFNDRSSFRRHKLIHTGKLFPCDKCEQSFMSQSSLGRHKLRSGH